MIFKRVFVTLCLGHKVKDTAEQAGNAEREAEGDSSYKHHGPQQHVELLLRQLRTHILNKRVDLTQAKHSQCLNTYTHAQFVH